MHKICTLCLFGLVVPVSAIVVQDYDTAEAAPSSVVQDLNWDYVYKYNNSSAVAVDTHWILTAKHVANAGWSNPVYSDDGTVYLPQEIRTTNDLALIRVDKALPGYYDLYTGDIRVSTNRVYMVGYGTTGTVSSTFWTGSNAGRGIKRWGSQQIDQTNTDEFSMSFFLSSKSTSTPYEAGAGEGDSGGGVFYKDGDTWKLAGINRSIGGGIGGGTFSRTNAMSMPYYADWVDTIPEPAAIGLMGFGTIGLFLARTKRRRKLVGRSLFLIRGDDPACDLAILKEENAGGEAFDRLVWLKQAQTHLLPALGKAHDWYKGKDKIFWNHMVATHERRVVRSKAIKLALKKKAITSFDAFLARVMK